MRSAAAKHHWTLIGSVKQVADELEAWFLERGADGFNILPSDVPASYKDVVNKLIPELQRRGLFHTEYEGKTLRENLGLRRPADLSTRKGLR
jgi:alkanesulfonate monooxygenase